MPMYILSELSHIVALVFLRMRFATTVQEKREMKNVIAMRTMMIGGAEGMSCKRQTWDLFLFLNDV